MQSSSTAVSERLVSVQHPVLEKEKQELLIKVSHETSKEMSFRDNSDEKLTCSNKTDISQSIQTPLSKVKSFLSVEHALKDKVSQTTSTSPKQQLVVQELLNDLKPVEVQNVNVSQSNNVQRTQILPNASSIEMTQANFLNLQLLSQVSNSFPQRNYNLTNSQQVQSSETVPMQYPHSVQTTSTNFNMSDAQVIEFYKQQNQVLQYQLHLNQLNNLNKNIFVPNFFNSSTGPNFSQFSSLPNIPFLSTPLFNSNSFQNNQNLPNSLSLQNITTNFPQQYFGNNTLSNSPPHMNFVSPMRKNTQETCFSSTSYKRRKISELPVIPTSREPMQKSNSDSIGLKINRNIKLPFASFANKEEEEKLNNSESDEDKKDSKFIRRSKSFDQAQKLLTKQQNIGNYFSKSSNKQETQVTRPETETENMNKITELASLANKETKNHFKQQNILPESNPNKNLFNNFQNSINIYSQQTFLGMPNNFVLQNISKQLNLDNNNNNNNNKENILRVSKHNCLLCVKKRLECVFEGKSKVCLNCRKAKKKCEKTFETEDQSETDIESIRN